MNAINFGLKAKQPDVEAVILGHLGCYSAKLVSDRTGLTESQVYARWKMAGIKVRDIRNYGNTFTTKIADAAKGESVNVLEGIKAQIRQLLPPVKAPNETQNRQS